ncbi:MAG TPA: hypothetical protein VFI92_07355, partial [Steroidobacteraceae bacterium]|nr:hypothetical protein [Steroidobacteraceae bacterium]
MTAGNDIDAKGIGRWLRLWLACLVLLLGAAFGAHAEDCSDYNGVLDGAAGTVPPVQLNIDQDCRVQNYTQANPFDSNVNFDTDPGDPSSQRYLIIFNNVYFTGQMSCNDNHIHNHRLWFTNGTIANSLLLHPQCRSLFIPVEKIDKQTPEGQTTATIGVPFTYTLTMPVMWDPFTGEVINDSGSLDDLHGTTIVDDLNATGVDLTYLSHVAYWEDTGDPVPHSFSDGNGSGVLTFDGFPIIPATRQIMIDVTVVLRDTANNSPGKTFVNTAKWDFGRLIDGQFYEPLPGESGISPPLTIAVPQMSVTKTGPATMTLGQWGTFTIDAHNTGLTDAWNVKLLDRLPDGPAGGMCDQTPEILSAQVFAADGVTPVAGKGPLAAGTDYSLGYAGAPTCELTFTALSAKATVGADERLVLTYRTRLDAGTQDGVTLTNVAGAIEWFNGEGSIAGRVPYTRTLTNGTPGTLDHEDDHTVLVAITGYFFEKTVANLTSGADPTTTAQPGHRLRYTLRLQTTTQGLNNFRLQDELDALNGQASFVPGSLSLVSALPGGAVNNSSATGGTRGTGLIDIGNLNLAPGSQLLLQFDVTLASTLLEDTIVSNQAQVLVGGTPFALSDDPYVNGQADPLVAGDEDPTRVVIALPSPSALAKANTQSTASIGEVFRYRITLPSTPFTFPLYDVRILDDLTASAADLRFVSVTKIAGSQPWTPVNIGTATNLIIADTTTGIDIPAGEQVTVEIAVQLENTPTNVAGLLFTNTASYLFNRTNGNAATQRPGGPGTTAPMTIVAPNQLTLDKSGPADMSLGIPATFTLNVHNPSLGTAWGLTITDRLPNTATSGMCDAAPTQVTAQMYLADGVTAVGSALVAGTDFSVTFAGDPTCTLTLEMLTQAAALAPGNRLIVTYQAELDALNTQGSFVPGSLSLV